MHEERNIEDSLMQVGVSAELAACMAPKLGVSFIIADTYNLWRLQKQPGMTAYTKSNDKALDILRQIPTERTRRKVISAASSCLLDPVLPQQE